MILSFLQYDGHGHATSVLNIRILLCLRLWKYTIIVSINNYTYFIESFMQKLLQKQTKKTLFGKRLAETLLSEF